MGFLYFLKTLDLSSIRIATLAFCHNIGSEYSPKPLVIENIPQLSFTAILFEDNMKFCYICQRTTARLIIIKGVARLTMLTYAGS